MKQQKNKKIVIDATTVWNAQKPQYNGFMCGYGYHGKKGYDRNAEKRKLLDKQRGIKSLFFFIL